MRRPLMEDPPVGFGVTAVVLGCIGLLLFFMPVLSVPLGCTGLGFGVLGLLLALWHGWATLRWAIGGLVLSGLALGVGLAMSRAAAGFLPTRPIPLDTRPVAQQPYIPPPARPEWP
ncbi:MAG: hypothetical protein LLG00_10590 [Planctomycetaceae bacterium]|nr:hypothetical protein [Planctomycetaceae bacterium]